MPNPFQRKKPAQAPNEGIAKQLRRIEGQEWWLWIMTVVVTLLLTSAIASFALPLLHFHTDTFYDFHINQSVRCLVGLVLIFDLYAIYQQGQIHRIRRQLNERDELFRLISENAADMIAVVDSQGQRVYNSPAYQTVLVYSAEELKNTSGLDHVHPDDQEKVIAAAERARTTGEGQTLEYRIRHKDGTWRILESTASVVTGADGTFTKLVIVNRDITERKRAQELLVHNAYHDALTTLPNRVLFLDRVSHASIRAKRHPEFKFAVLFVDIDDFKVFNDSLGHTSGDQLLVEISKRLTATLRRFDTISRQIGQTGNVDPAKDTLARLGGDEFTVLIEEIRDESDAIRVAQRIQESLRLPFTIDGQEIFSTASIGIALSTSPHDSAEELLRDADLAMYRAKSLGKARSEVFDTALHSRAVQRLKLETDLRRGLEQSEFRVFYQPIICLQNSRIVGFEALLRWQRPGAGLVSPGEFVTAADESGLIVPINREYMLEACRQTRLWQQEFPGLPPLTISLNISPRQFMQADLPDEIANVLNSTALDPSCMQLEIMETVAMADADRAETVLPKLKALGVRLSIDDFGTGYSSLGRLRRFLVDSLKIDRAFVSKMDEDPDNRAIVSTIVMLAHNLGLKVVAEGTERQEEVWALEKLKCDFAQGYLFSRPVDNDAARKLLIASYGKQAQAAAAASKA